MKWGGNMMAQKNPDSNMNRGSRKAATYSPTWCGSTIGADGLNYPVRYGKGWAPSPWPPKSWTVVAWIR